MAEYIYPSSEMLAEIIRRLESITHDQFIAPDADAPADAIFVGDLTDNLKALLTLQDLNARAHDKAHEAKDLKRGGNTNLPFDHRLMHVMNGVLNSLIGEAMTQTFPAIYEKKCLIDRRWKVYIVTKDEPADDTATKPP